MDLALTAAEWRLANHDHWNNRDVIGDEEGVGFISPGGVLRVTYDSAVCAVKVRNRHGIAALALYGQPFGFTWEDVALLRSIASVAHTVTYGAPDSGDSVLAETLELRSLADRIAALLAPPEVP